MSRSTYQNGHSLQLRPRKQIATTKCRIFFKTFSSLSNILADRSQGIALTKKISMQKAQSFTGLPPIPPNLLATETRQFTDVSEMNELFKGRADVRFIQKMPGGVSVKSRLTSIGTMRIQQLCWSGQLIVEAGTAKNQTALILPQTDATSGNYFG
jgi:hypothetical protein